MGDQWTLLVLRDLIIERKRYFREFLESEERIASNVLTARLKMLEANGIVSRRADPDSARQVIYAPTQKGMDLLPAMLELARWGATYDPETLAPKGFAERIKLDRSSMIAEIQAENKKVLSPKNTVKIKRR